MKKDTEGRCHDCGVSTFVHEGDYYMVTPEIWNEFGLGGSYYVNGINCDEGWSEDTSSGMLCMKDLEKRMGRSLQLTDLMVDVPINSYWYSRL